MAPRRAIWTVVVFLSWIGGALAQSWVQVEARPTLEQASARAQAYMAALSNVEGFRLRSGWYAIALGPFEADDARRVLLDLRRAGIIPNDSFVTDRRPFREQFWPAAGSTSSPGPAPQAPDPTVAAPAPAPEPEPQEAQETPSEARRNEALLERSEREALQVALQWFGFYTGGIDGAFGRGTRRSMGEWQASQGFPATGILTTRQRGLLQDAYKAELASLGLGEVVDQTAGISLTMPIGLVAFERYETPFAHYKPKDNSGVEVLLISQQGDQETLFGLYEVMQTLEIIPLEGDRSRNPTSFTIFGGNQTRQSYTFARLERGYVKGFTLAYPPERAADMARVIPIMQGSLTILDGALGDAQRNIENQSLDLISGLEIRKPKLTASGFFVTDGGDIITAAQALGRCERITIDDTHQAEVIASNRNIALLRSSDVLSPLDIARFNDETQPLRSEVIVGGYSYGGDLTAPTVTYGTLEDIFGLNGERNLKRLSVNTLPGDIGGPVLSPTGAIGGMLLPPPIQGRALPSGVEFALKSEDILRFLESNEVAAQRQSGQEVLDPEDIVIRARDMTVLVSCW